MCVCVLLLCGSAIIGVIIVESVTAGVFAIGVSCC